MSKEQYWLGKETESTIFKGVRKGTKHNSKPINSSSFRFGAFYREEKGRINLLKIIGYIRKYLRKLNAQCRADEDESLQSSTISCRKSVPGSVFHSPVF